MRIAKHFVKVAGYYLKRIACKHKDCHESSCPFTGYTYTTCVNCATRVAVRETDAKA
jgi:hypothetical protein